MNLVSRFASDSPALLSGDSPLTDGQIASFAPSVFAKDPHESRSQRYQYIPTIDVLRNLRNHGFEPFFAVQTRVRNLDKREYTKHMIRLRHADDIGSSEVDEIILLNSHDGTSKYQMLGGVFRFVCQNGMVCGDLNVEIRVPHRGDVIAEVIKGIFRMRSNFKAAVEQREGMRATILNDYEQFMFARKALELRYENATGMFPITETQLLRARRFEDQSTDLWTIFNRVQENIIKGGLRGRNRDGKVMTTRPIRGIDTNLKLNRALWLLADKQRRH